LLDDLADQLHREAAAGAAMIMREFSAAISEARRRAPRHELAGILAALKQRRRAALALARRRAAIELQGRRKLVVQNRRAVPPRASRARMPLR
jgi:hypothetical protein